MCVVESTYWIAVTEIAGAVAREKNQGVVVTHISTLTTT
jgi:hypothetical protein